MQQSQPGNQSVTTKRRRTSFSTTTKKQRTTAETVPTSPSSSEQREARKFWNDFTQQLSDQLWLPTINDPHVESSCSQNTWFTAMWKSRHITENDSTKNPHQAPHCIKKTRTHKRRRRRRTRCNNNKKKHKKRKRCKGDDEEEKEEKEDDASDDAPPKEFKVKKIKLRLLPGQRSILNRWLGTFRWTYNQILKAVEKGDVPRQKGKIRAKFINNCNFGAEEKMKWVTDTPYEIRDAAMSDLLAAYKSNFATRQKNKDHTFEIKPKTKKAPTNSFVIHHKHYKNGGSIFPSFWRKDMRKPKNHEANQPRISPYLRGYERLPKTLDHAARLQRTRNGEFYLCIVSPIEVAPSCSESVPSHDIQELETSDRVIALDPGVRSFMTGFSPGKEGVMEWGVGDRTRLFRLCCAYDDLQSRWSQKGVVKHRKRYKMQRAGRRMQQRIRNLVNEVHCKLVKWLVTNFDVVLLPKFETQRMCQKTQIVSEDGTRRKTRKINGKVARGMYTWSHYRFQQRLLHKIREFPQCRVVICDEDFTSKTCGRCGFVHEKLGGNKTFKCPSCHVSLDRDVNGARNILLRYLTLNHAC